MQTTKLYIPGSILTFCQPVHHIGSSHNRAARPFGAPASQQPRTTISPESHISIRDSFPDAAGHPAARGRNLVSYPVIRICESKI